MLDELLGILRKHPQVHFEHGEHFIRIQPSAPEGFEVAIEEVWENHYSVSYNRWQQDFYTAEEAANCFLFGLSNRCRLKVQSKDGVPFRWTVEFSDGSDWQERSTKSGWSYRFLSPATTVYLQNDLLPVIELHPVVAG